MIDVHIHGIGTLKAAKKDQNLNIIQIQANQQTNWQMKLGNVHQNFIELCLINKNSLFFSNVVTAKYQLCLDFSTEKKLKEISFIVLILISPSFCMSCGADFYADTKVNPYSVLHLYTLNIIDICKRALIKSKHLYSN